MPLVEQALWFSPVIGCFVAGLTMTLLGLRWLVGR
jgi:hypothetical protein